MKKRVSLLIIFILIGVCSYSQPSPPILISPLVPVCPGSVLLDWTDVTGATSYRVQIFDGASIILDVSGIPVSQYLILAGILQSNSQYCWRVNATGPSGTSQWTPQWYLTILSIPNAPSLLMPPNGATNFPIFLIFDWVPVSGATYYIFHLSKSPLFDSLVVNDTTPLQQIILQYNTQYYWRMKSGNSCGTGNWSPVWTFTTILAPPAAPILICDTANVPITPTLDWNDVPTATSYKIQVSNAPFFSNLIIDAEVGVSQYTVPPGILIHYSHYCWRAKAINIGGEGNWSTICSFNIVQTGIGIISSEIPTEYKLYSNYPNPFNPTTKIKFDIPRWRGEGGWTVTLKIYDITGREVQTLVNESLKPGTYEATFDGSQLTNGVYFYKLMTDGFTETKRMILIK